MNRSLILARVFISGLSNICELGDESQDLTCTLKY